jgi:serine/threonine protein phosphatase PrpC
MGGAAKGEVASAMAVEAIAGSLRGNGLGHRPESAAAHPAFSNETNALVHGVKLANRKIHEEGMRDPACRGMGATIVAARIRGRRLSLAHVGDSRAYLFRGGALQQLTSDHSLVAEQVRHGLITHQQAAVSELQSVLTRALGIAEDVEIDTAEIELFPGDSLLLCSDGLTRMVPDDEMAGILGHAHDVRRAAERLVSKANESGGQDNITVVVIHVQGPFKSWFAKFFPWGATNLI